MLVHHNVVFMLVFVIHIERKVDKEGFHFVINLISPRLITESAFIIGWKDFCSLFKVIPLFLRKLLVDFNQVENRLGNFVEL